MGRHPLWSGNATGGSGRKRQRRRLQGYLGVPLPSICKTSVWTQFPTAEDNVRPHRAAAVREFLEAEGVEQLPWPACSPDMNPIEHAWDALGRAINDRDVIPQTLQELADALREEWDAMPVDVVNKLLDSMPRRLHALIRARGGHTRY